VVCEQLAQGCYLRVQWLGIEPTTSRSLGLTRKPLDYQATPVILRPLWLHSVNRLNDRYKNFRKIFGGASTSKLCYFQLEFLLLPVNLVFNVFLAFAQCFIKGTLFLSFIILSNDDQFARNFNQR